jgi:hypothetical protein
MPRTLALVVLGLFLALVPAANSAAAKPPGFALWSASEGNHEDALTGPITAGCAKTFAKDDLRAGECIVHGALRVYPAMNAHWGSGVARIAKGQKPACKLAIHAYWLAATKNFAASYSYFKAHQKHAATDINSDLNGEPYATLSSLKDEAKSHAIRVCG